METIETQTGLNEVVINKVQRMIDNKKPAAQAAIDRLISEGQNSQDFIAPLGVNLKDKGDNPVITFTGNGHVLMNMPEGQFSLHDNAIGQLGDKMGVPARYLRNLASGDEWQRKLAATVLNEHSGWTQRSRILVRAVGDEVRGVLSDSYRRLNSVSILTAFIQAASTQGAVIADAYMSDTKVWAETILPTPFTIPTVNNGDIVMFAGARFSTSDYGNGSVDMRTFLLNGACLNGMVRESVMKQVHLGSKLPDNLRLSDRTYQLDTQTTVSAVKDLTEGIYGKENIMQKAIEIQAASGMIVDLDGELKKLVGSGKLQKQDSASVEKILMNGNPDDGVTGAASLWKLTSAITAHARDLDGERSRELHEISGELMARAAKSTK